MRYPNFIGGAYTLDSVAADCQRCVNLYPEINEGRTSANGERGVLRVRPGLRQVIGTSGSVRGLYTASDGQLYAAYGNQMNVYGPTNVGRSLGNLLTSGTGFVRMADNGTQLMAVDGVNGYIYTLGSSDTLYKITDDGFFPGTTVEFLDGYFIVPRTGTRQYHYSALNDGSNWNALDFQTVQGTPDLIQTLKVFNRQIWIFKRDSLEIHYNTGSSTAPFQRIEGGLIHTGAASPYCVEIAGNTIFWLDSSKAGYGIVWKSTGMTPERISTHAIEQTLKSYGDLSGAFAWSYQDGGHVFYCLSIPYTQSTWCYDIATGLWHERTTLDEAGRERVTRVSSHALAFGRHYVGDRSSNSIYNIDDDYHYDGNQQILWKRTAPHLNSGLKRNFYTSFELDFEAGMGLVTGQGSDPQIFMRYSSDRGHTWTPPIPASAGRIGDYKARARWTRLGSARDRVFEVSGSDPIKWTILGAEVGVSQGRS